MKVEKKKRTDRVRLEDRNVEKLVHQGKGYKKVVLTNERARGKKWGEFVKTRKAARGVRRSKGKGRRKK
jgi:ribosomal protein S19